MYECHNDHPPNIDLKKKAVLATSLMIHNSFMAISHTQTTNSTKFNTFIEKMVC